MLVNRHRRCIQTCSRAEPRHRRSERRGKRHEKGILFALVWSAAAVQRLLLPCLHFWQFIPTVVCGRIQDCKGNLTKHWKVWLNKNAERSPQRQAAVSRGPGRQTDLKQERQRSLSAWARCRRWHLGLATSQESGRCELHKLGCSNVVCMPARVQCTDVHLKCASMDLLCSLHSYLPVRVSEVWKEYACFSVWTIQWGHTCAIW